MDFGILFANSGPLAQPDLALTMARSAEDVGFTSLWTVEHVTVPKDYQSTYPYGRSGRMPGGEESAIPDPLIWMAFVAAATTRIKLATGILILPQRQPLVVAKEIATLDVLAKGRTIIGVGAGWLEEEFRALGVPFEDRGARLDDYIVALRTIWRDPVASHGGRFAPFENCITLPKPPRGEVPIVIGGHTNRAARRAGALGNGFFPGRGTPEELSALIDIVHRSARDAGRDPSQIELITGHSRDLDTVKRMRDLGFTHFVIPPPNYDPAKLRDGLARYADEVISRL